MKMKMKKKNVTLPYSVENILIDTIALGLKDPAVPQGSTLGLKIEM